MFDQQLYSSSPRADRAASQGLGGAQGLAVASGCIAIVLAVTLFLGKSGGPETVAQVAASGGGDSLSSLASQLSK